MPLLLRKEISRMMSNQGDLREAKEVQSRAPREPWIDENDQIQAIEFGDNRIDLPHTDKIMLISKMKKLRWLRLIGDKGNGEAPNCLSNELRMQELLWKGYKHLPQLKVLQLIDMERLVSTPDFNGLPRLQKLELTGCRGLEEIHTSLGNHRSLKSVHVSFCYKLSMFPTIVRMEQLESLRISNCHKSLVFLEIQANMERLVKLDVDGIQIDALLSSIGTLYQPYLSTFVLLF
ncbi:Toll/interleukin-1 receptor domain-containing protein [Tanacetum coccineum]